MKSSTIGALIMFGITQITQGTPAYVNVHSKKYVAFEIMSWYAIEKSPKFDIYTVDLRSRTNPSGFILGPLSCTHLCRLWMEQ